MSHELWHCCRGSLLYHIYAGRQRSICRTFSAERRAVDTYRQGGVSRRWFLACDTTITGSCTGSTSSEVRFGIHPQHLSDQGRHPPSHSLSSSACSIPNNNIPPAIFFRKTSIAERGKDATASHLRHPHLNQRLPCISSDSTPSIRAARCLLCPATFQSPSTAARTHILLSNHTAKQSTKGKQEPSLTSR
jgi:hypothetical protein